jgi:CBS domain-containing protein
MGAREAALSLLALRRTQPGGEMSTLQNDPVRYAGPPFEKARVHDAMRIGVVTCRPETSLEDVAQMMATFTIHSVVVEEDGVPHGIVSAIDIATGGSSDLSDTCAADIATKDLVTIPADETLEQAARTMSEHGVTHLIAVQPGTERPVGVFSASGLAAVLAARA